MGSFPDLISPLYAEVEKRIARRPIHSNLASSLGGACERELVYDRVAWEQATLPSVNLQAIFEEGGVHERKVLRDLADAGFQVLEQQSTLEWREFQITGHVDAVVAVNGAAIPIDVKSMHPNIWRSIARRGKAIYEWEEVAPGFQKKPWLKRYLGQITLYALLKNTDQGILLLKDKATGEIAQVNVTVDFAYGEELLQRATRINSHVAAGTLPERIPWDDGDTCSRCKYLGICLPDRVGINPLVFVTEQRVEGWLEERVLLEDQAMAYEAIDQKLKAWAKARSEMKMVIGRWLIEKKVSASRTVTTFSRFTNQADSQNGVDLAVDGTV